jgi:GT2 family glycosyltransferase
VGDRSGPAAGRASVIIVSYNHREHLGRCLKSLQAAKGAGSEAEVILVDNASTDGSADYVAEAFPWVRLVRSNCNRGFGGANNLGADLAQGEYLAFLNPDTAVETGWLAELVGALEESADAGLATSRILLMNDPTHINTCGNDVHITGLTLCRGMGKPRQAYDHPAEVGAVSGAAFAIRRNLFEELGGFDQDFFLYMEDTDLSWRARLAGYRILYVPTSIVYHDYSLRFWPHKTYYQERNRYLMLLKSLRWRTLLAMLPALLLGEIVTWGFSLLRDRRRLGNKLRAYAWVIKNWRRVMAQRHRTQALRRVRDRELLLSSVARVGFEQTGRGPVTQMAHLVLDPLFAFLHWLPLVVVRS